LSQPFREKLSNGVAIAGEAISSVETVAVGIWINCGSRDEKKEENGLTHLIEHMAFKGTAHFTAEEIVETIEGRGGYINAFTTKESSCYYAKVFKEDIEPAVRVLSELVLYPRFDEHDLRNERKVVLSEMQEVDDDPEDWGMDFVEEKIFSGNPLAMPILGKASSLKSFASGDLLSFHSKNFTTDRIVVSVAGNFEWSNLIDLANRYLSSKAGNHHSPEKTRSVRRERSGISARLKPASRSGGNFVVHRDTGRQAHILICVPAAGLNDSDRYAASMIGVILGDGSSSRLYKMLREKDGLAYSIYTFGSAYADSGILGIYASTAIKDILRAEERILKVANDFVMDGPTKDEVARAKAQLKAGIVFSLENLWDRASLFARDELYYDGRSNLAESLEAIEKVTDADIMAAARKYLLQQDGIPKGVASVENWKTGEPYGLHRAMTSLKILPNTARGMRHQKKGAMSGRIKSNSKRRSR